MSSSFEVRISTRAERDLFRLPEKIGAACLAFIFGPLAEQPYRLGGELRGQLAGLRSARRGSYRILYRIDDELRRLDVVHIDHRGDVPMTKPARKVSGRSRRCAVDQVGARL